MTTTPMTYAGDMFAGGEYDAVANTRASIQALRGETDTNMFGYFITQASLDKIGYKYDAKDLVEYTYSSGSTELGLLLKNPRMLVSQKTPLMAVSEAEVDGKKTSSYEKYDANFHSDRAKYKPCTSYDILLVDDNNNLLHETPLKYTGKGANGASFNAELNKFYTDVVKTHAQLNRISTKPKDNKFKSLCVFVPTIKRELAGDKTKSPACKIVGYKLETPAKFAQMFIGVDYDKALKVWEILEPVNPNEFKVLGAGTDNTVEASIVIQQDRVYLAQFIDEFSKQYGGDRNKLEDYCKQRYNVTLENMSNNQLLNALDTLVESKF